MTTNKNTNISTYYNSAKKAIETEMAAIQQLFDRLDDAFTHACDLILTCKGRVIVTGMGKSGHIGNKIAATLASTGTPAFFMHPAEASHGDLGMITKDDILIAISNSGTTQEIITILPTIKRLGIPIISFIGNINSTLGKQSNITLNTSVNKEACPLNLAPTASTTTALVLGDALAIALLDARGFTEEDFALSHPHGQLGRRLLLRLKDIMLVDEDIPKVHENASLKETLVEMSKKSLGMAGIVSDNDQLVGLFTDGDVRRTLDHECNVNTTCIKDIMTKDFISANPDLLAAEALKLMEIKKINGFLVTDENNKLIGALNLHTLLRAGVL